ncbi:MAG: response regulator [Gammaproteobacteria bacterium]|jgi:CheY-like chemotaxis protein|nr:MAG: response regulator [Gammaproteobacteria bacterium]
MNAKNPAKILLVDDDPALQELISISLELNGQQVLVASNGSEAMSLVDAQAPDLIILDLVMPVMDGVCFIRWLRQERASAVPVLIMTGVARPGMVEELKSSGATEVVRKPIDVTTFLDKVNQLLQG